MQDTKDTRMISLDEPVTEAIVKVLDERVPWDADLSQETSDVVCLGEEESSMPLKPIYVTDKPLHFYEWLGIASTRLSRWLITGLAATQIDLTRLTSDPQLTITFDPHAILKVISAEKSSVVSVSPSLIMTRSEVHSSSLLAPSGAYLTWLEMLAEEIDD